VSTPQDPGFPPPVGPEAPPPAAPEPPAAPQPPAAEPPVAPEVPAPDTSAPATIGSNVEVAGSYPAATIVPGVTDPAVPSSGETSRAARRRAAEEAAQAASQDSRRRVLIVSGVVLGLLAAITLVWAVFGRGGGEEPAPTPSPTATGPIQPTLLFQIKNAQGIAIDNALLSVGGSTGRANVVTVPYTLVVDVATGGTLPFGEVARLPDPDASAGALSDATGINVDATLSMDTLAFSGLVDAVGGVVADVDVDVVQKQPDGSEVVVVQAGKGRTLQGPQAAAYATYLAPGEPEEARMARFAQVLRLVVAKLPQDASKVEAIFTGLGASSRATVPTSQVAAFFLRLNADVLGDDVVYRNLPVKTIQDGGTPTSYTVDPEANAKMVAELFPDAARKPGPNSKVRVLVQNGVGSPGLNAQARQQILDAGYTFVNGGNAATLGQPTTAIVVPDRSPESLTWGADIATALNVPQTAVQVATTGQSVADVIVVLGADFKPTS
jgi:anionic cell wall polymer biosynthesis LytR-Cps2A-Psr (LCP) family protein